MDKNFATDRLDENLDSVAFNLYEKREKIYTRRIEGFFQKIRLFTGWPLLLGYFLVPWLSVNGHQAILFDLPERKFHIFWLTFWPQDFGLLAWALMIAAFSLFFVTNLLGRVWCGYSCPQTVWTAIFIWAEQFAEGDRNQRIKLEKAPWTLIKVYKRFLKHCMWVGFALLTGATFVAYFYGIYDLLADAFQLELPLVTVFWCSFFTIATYINAGWLREQVCLHMCPYARFQSSMFDNDTLIVSYDPARGEERGPRKRQDNPSEIGLGDCIDCQMCVQVCPTGIDIRDGLQYECINCALCVDACNSIMDKMGYDRGLVAYTTEHQLDGGVWTWKRPRLIGYGFAVITMLSLFSYNLITRTPLELDVLRNRGQLFQEIDNGRIQNTYTIKILNMDLYDHTYKLSVEGLPSAIFSPNANIFVEGGKIGEISTNLIVDPDLLRGTNTKIKFFIETVFENQKQSILRASSDSSYLGPKPLAGPR
ncbi:MAG: cytochrome c oxidase accessory protein FixG [Candidatus Azotimanducaceae bacterium]|jgi:cytochrome c oxidase accessory protein FixG